MLVKFVSKGKTEILQNVIIIIRISQVQIVILMSERLQVLVLQELW